MHKEHENIEKILLLTKKRIDYFHDTENVKNWYQGSNTYFDGILKETAEAQIENKVRNHIYLEDELGDIFWNFCCLLSSLEREHKISSRGAVFARAYQKFSERIGEDGRGGHNWEAIKIQQKNRRTKEHNQFYEEK